MDSYDLRKKNGSSKKTLADPEKAVWLSLFNLQSRGSHRLKTIDISQNLGFWNSSEFEIVQCVLNKLKADGRVDNLGDTDDGWVIPWRRALVGKEFYITHPPPGRLQFSSKLSPEKAKSEIQRLFPYANVYVKGADCGSKGWIYVVGVES